MKKKTKTKKSRTPKAGKPVSLTKWLKSARPGNYRVRITKEGRQRLAEIRK